MLGSYSGLCYRIWSCYIPHKSEKWFLGTVRVFYLDELDLATDVTTLTNSLIAGLEDMGYSSPPALRKKIQPSLSASSTSVGPRKSSKFFPRKGSETNFQFENSMCPLFLWYRLRWYRVCMSLYFIDIYECIYIYTTQHKYKILKEYDIYIYTSHILLWALPTLGKPKVPSACSHLSTNQRPENRIPITAVRTRTSNGSVRHPWGRLIVPVVVFQWV